MLYFIPAWYQQDKWCENEQNWHVRRARTEFDDTVKHIQLFHRSKAYPFQVLLLSFAPNFRHFLHRQSVFHAPYWSCFDAIQEVRRKKVVTFSVHNINWPEHIEFIYTPFVMVAQLNGERYAQVEFGEDGNPIQIDMFKEGAIVRRNIYDDRGFVSSTIVFENQSPKYQDYLTDKGTWKIRQHFSDGHVEVNPKQPNYIIDYNGEEQSYAFSRKSYSSMDDVILEVLNSYISHTKKEDVFCMAMYDLHLNVLRKALKGRKTIVSFFNERYDIEKGQKDMDIINNADYIITDSQDQLHSVEKCVGSRIDNIIDITPFDSRVDFGISQQLNVQKIMVPIDGLGDNRFEQLIQCLGRYVSTHDKVRIVLFTRIADYSRNQHVLERTRECLGKAGLEINWATEESLGGVVENNIDLEDKIPVKFYVEQCVDELSVSKCIREQRIMLDMRPKTDLYLRITGISVGIPQIVYRKTQFVNHGKNGFVIKDMESVESSLSYYLDNLTNWNEAMVYSYELGKKYTTKKLVQQWKEVLKYIGDGSNFTTGD